MRTEIDAMVDGMMQRKTPTFPSALRKVSNFKSNPLLERIVTFIRAQGIEAVGQSSRGPTLYAVTENEANAQSLTDHLRSIFDLNESEVFVTAADNQGCEVISR